MPGDIRKMTAAILVEQHRPLVVDEVELPELLAAGQVFVRVHYSGICGSQIGEVDGVKGPDPYLPHLLGHEGCATVLQTGPGVCHVGEGDRVVMHWRKGAGIDSQPPTFRWRGKTLNAGAVTTFNEYSIVSENRLTVISKKFAPELATLFGCPVTTGLGVIINNARVSAGQSVVVLGIGGVGLSAVQGAALAGAHPIIAVDRFDKKLALATQVGATNTIEVGDDDLARQLRSAVGDGGADVVIETTGLVSLIETAYEFTAARGTTVLVGVPRFDAKASIHTLPLHFGKKLIGSHGGETVPQRDIPRYIKLYESGKLNLDIFITARYPLNQVNTAIELVRSGEIAGRCLLEIDPIV